jgi:hypothetical protein
MANNHAVGDVSTVFEHPTHSMGVFLATSFWVNHRSVRRWKLVA